MAFFPKVKITQAILTKAFRGGLVPTGAELARQEGRDYEHASSLLVRIRATYPASDEKPTRCPCVSPNSTKPPRRMDALFKLADGIEAHVAAATARADKITQAILAKAFRGELVPTESELARQDDRDYEPPPPSSPASAPPAPRTTRSQSATRAPSPRRLRLPHRSQVAEKPVVESAKRSHFPRIFRRLKRLR